MADVPLKLLPHRVTVETYTGDSGYGPRYENPVSGIRCLRDGQIVLQPDGTLADPVRLFLRLDQRDRVTVRSRVSWGSVVAIVEAVQVRDDGGLGAWQHVEAMLR